MYLLFVAFLVSCGAIRKSAISNVSASMSQVHIWHSARFRTSTHASGKPQLVQTRSHTDDSTVPAPLRPASLIEVVEPPMIDRAMSRLWKREVKDPPVQLTTVPQLENLMLEATYQVHDKAKEWAKDDVKIESILHKFNKINNVCVKTIAQYRDNVCVFQAATESRDLRFELLESIPGMIFTTIAKRSRAMITKALQCINVVSNVGSEVLKIIEEYLIGVANYLEISFCERACLALCASKMLLKFSALPAGFTSLNVTADVAVQMGKGVCHEFATLATSLAKSLGVTSWVDMGDVGNDFGNNTGLDRWASGLVQLVVALVAVGYGNFAGKLAGLSASAYGFAGRHHHNVFRWSEKTADGTYKDETFRSDFQYAFDNDHPDDLSLNKCGFYRVRVS